MANTNYAAVFSAENMIDIFPESLADQFFEALLGDAAEGAYDISIAYKANTGKRLEFEIILKERPGKCLACHLTHGLPEVFSRHPLIDLNGVVGKIAALGKIKNGFEDWRLGRTRGINRKVHAIPLYITISDG